MIILLLLPAVTGYHHHQLNGSTQCKNVVLGDVNVIYIEMSFEINDWGKTDFHQIIKVYTKTYNFILFFL
jgi:hypothetical protein